VVIGYYVYRRRRRHHHHRCMDRMLVLAVMLMTNMLLTDTKQREHMMFNSPDMDFVTARTLDEIINNVDPEKFQWVNHDEIKPGVLTCGFLHAPLGSVPDVEYAMNDACKI
jgi:hypothetical protein